MPQTILIVANDPNIVYLLQRYAEKTGFQTRTAHQREDIGALAQQTTPTAIILEDDFPGTLYRETLRQLKSAPATRAIPVIVYSCLESAAEKPAEGVAGCLHKSVKYDDFVAALEQATGSSG